MTQPKIGVRFLWDLFWLVLAVHFLYSIIFIGILPSTYKFGNSTQTEFFDIVKLGTLLFYYFAPIPVLVFFFIKSELKEQAGGKGPLERGTFVRSQQDVKEGVEALLLSIRIYLPFFILLIISGFFISFLEDLLTF